VTLSAVMRVASKIVLAFAAGGCSAPPCQPVQPLVTLPVHESAHRVRLLEGGFESLVTRVDLIRSARRSITIQTFIWRNDEAGRLLLFELIEAARRGVTVRVLADQMFSENDAEVAAVAATAHEQVAVRAYNPIADRVAPTLLASLSKVLLDFRNLNQRMHNKVMVVDGEVAVTGGRNIQNAYFDLDPRLNYRDRDVVVRGPAVSAMIVSFEEYWSSPLAVPLDSLLDVADCIARADLPSLRDARDFGVAEVRAEVDRDLPHEPARRSRDEMTVDRVAFLADVPGKNSATWLDASGRITEQLVTVLCGAEREVLIQSPYLVLGDRASALLGGLRDADVDVVISTNSLAATDSWQTYGIFYQQKRRILDDLDLEVHELKPVPLGARARRPEPETAAFYCLHSKSMVIDDRLGMVGSYNLDPRSGNLNTEVALLVFDEAFAGRLEASIREDVAPDQSWVLAERDRPLLFAWVGDLADGCSDLLRRATTLDPLPSRFASCFELRPGEPPVSRRHPAFHDRYDEVGNFPGLGIADQKVILARLVKGLGGVVTPIL